jgi:hypothetical protein
MQPRRFQALKNILFYLLLLTPYLLVQLVILSTWPSQSEISPEKAGALFALVYGAVVSLFGIGWAWSKGKDGIRRGSGWMRWGFILMLILFVGLFIVELR